MRWDRLLSQERLCGGEDDTPRIRSGFRRDWDRIVFSFDFRRLQDKTQVHPWARTRNDYVRTRLTHSLEVGSVGRSLGAMVADRLRARQPGLFRDGQLDGQDFAGVVAAACLAHDIGNPPFGHHGEEVIRKWFRERGDSLLAGLSPEQRSDFTCFDGNPQSFRILVRLANDRQQGGLQLCAATLAATCKYPCPATDGRVKHGYSFQDAPVFARVAELTGLPFLGRGYARHPLSWLVEAADDICYLVVDLEDGARLGLIPGEDARRLFLGLVADGVAPELPLHRLRGMAIDALAHAAVDAFFGCEDAIMAGSNDTPLLGLVPQAETLERIRELSAARVYPSPGEFVEMDRCLERSLDRWMTAVTARPLAPETAREIFFGTPVPEGVYERCLAGLDHVAGMTDRYAIDQARPGSGWDLPG